MKKTFLVLTLMLLSVSAIAQNAAQKKRMAEIRTLYAQAMQDSKVDPEVPEADNHLYIDIQRMLPGAGLQNVKTSFFSKDAGDEDNLYKLNVFFIRSKYNLAALNFVEEYVVDRETQNPVFIFFNGNSYQHDGTVEKRYYFYADGKPCFLQITHKDAEGDVISKDVVTDFNDNNDALDMYRFFQENINVYNAVMYVGLHE